MAPFDVGVLAHAFARFRSEKCPPPRQAAHLLRLEEFLHEARVVHRAHDVAEHLGRGYED